MYGQQKVSKLILPIFFSASFFAFHFSQSFLQCKCKKNISFSTSSVFSNQNTSAETVSED